MRKIIYVVVAVVCLVALGSYASLAATPQNSENKEQSKDEVSKQNEQKEVVEDNESQEKQLEYDIENLRKMTRYPWTFIGNAPYKIDNMPAPLFIDSLRSSYTEEEKLSTAIYSEGVKRNLIYGKSREAIILLATLIQQDSTYAPAYYSLADLFAKRGNAALALAYSIVANELDTTNVWYKSQLGRLYVINNSYRNAEKIYEQLIELLPNNPENYSMLAALYEHAKQPFSALAVLERAETVFGKVEQLTEYKRDILVRLRLYDRAIREGQEVIDSNPYRYENHLALAQLYAETKRDSLAQQSYENALELNPWGIDILASMVEFYKITGDNSKYLEYSKMLLQSDEIMPDKKLMLLQEITSNRPLYSSNRFQVRELVMLLYAQYPNNYDFIQEYTNSLLLFGEMELATETYKRYVGSGVGGIKLYNDILDIEGYLDRPDSVNKYLAIGLKEYKNSYELYLRQGFSMQHNKNHKGAMKAYKKALKNADSDSVRSMVYGIMGDISFEQKRVKQAYSYYDSALECDFDNINVLNNYAYFLSEQGLQLEKALKMARRVMELTPSNATYIDTYGWILYKLGRYSEAKEIMLQAVALDTQKSSVLLLHYGDILAALGENYMATVYWRRALEAGHDENEIDQRLKSVEGK